MTPERWQKVKAVFDLALEREPAQRAEFVSLACGADESLRREVESLIASHEKSGEFIDAPAYEAAAELIVDEKARLKPGQTIGAYELVSFITRGGMGEVYLAQDRRLHRKVALKILPVSFTKNADRLARFEQEARTASALNHPNIITIYEILKTKSTHVIATEFVEGETVRERLSHSSLSLKESLQIAIQVADALAAAHQVGIIHRDIKPENIMLRPDGYVKVLDFGLAKLSEQAPSVSPDEALTKQVRTGSGVVIGTAGYMSPEQARGKTVDARSDIFSLGAVIYEMVTQQKPFDGETASDVLASILKSEPPPISQIKKDLPPELSRIVTKALRKDREERYQVIKDLLLDLKSLAQDLEFEQRLKQGSAPVVATGDNRAATAESAADAANPTHEIIAPSPTLISAAALSSMIKPRRWPLFALLVVIVAAGLSGLYILMRGSNSVVSPPVVTNVTRLTAWTGLDTQPTLAPGGNSVAYSSNHNGSFEIYVKQLAPGGREIQLTSDGQENFQPAWSPDGKLIAYDSKKRGGIWVMPALGGAARQLTDFGSAPAWSHDSKMVAFQSDATPVLGISSVGSSTIWVVAADGGAPKQITKVGNPTGAHATPTWSPDNQRIAFVVLNYTTQQIWSVSITGTDLKQLSHRPGTRVGQSANWKDPLRGRAGFPLYSPDGRSLYFVVDSALWMLPISPKDDEPIDDPVRVTNTGAAIIANLTFSGDGKKMAYCVQTVASNIWSLSVSPNNLAAGTPKQLTNQTGTRNSQPAFSADGRRLAFVQFLQGGRVNLLVADSDGNNPTPTPSYGNIPSWFPDGDRIAFTSARDNHWSVWVTSLQKGREQVLYDAGRDIQYARLSPDGQHIAFNLADNKGVINLWTAPVSGGEPKQLTFDQELAGFPAWSPDSKFIAYQMKRGDDAYVMLIPSEGGEATQFITEHGRSWPYSFSPDGDKILFAGERNGVWNIWWVSRSTKELKQLTNYTKLNAYVRYPAWSPLGNQIAYEYAETIGNIWVLDLK